MAKALRQGLGTLRGGLTLRARIALVASVAVALAVIGASVGVYIAAGSDLRGQIDHELLARARDFAGSASASPPPPSGGDGAEVPPGPRGSGGRAHRGFPGSVEPVPLGGPSGYVQFVSPAGEVFVPGGQGAARGEIPLTGGERRIAAVGSGVLFNDRSVDGTELRVLTSGTGPGGAVVVAQPLTSVEHELSQLLLILALIAAGGIVLAALLGALVARAALAPITHFTERTEALTGRLDLSRRLDVGGRDELGRLAGSFNATLDALERAVGAQRQLIADASHELRTPISSLRANIQTLADAERLPEEDQEALRADIVAELDELTALVGDVAELARGSASDGATDDVRLDEVVAGAVETARRRNVGEETRFVVSLEPTLVRGQPERIARAVSNVLDNARKWSPVGATIEVTLGGGVLSVRDHGPGFPEADLPFVFDRFYRAPAARGLPGSGLGLAIVRQAAESSGGFAEALNVPGGGALVRVGFGARGAAPPASGVRPGGAPAEP